MCDINKQTSLKTMTVYKTVYKDDEGNYRSVFNHTIIRIGTVPILRSIETSPAIFYNGNMIGRVSGFAKKKDAFILASSSNIFKGRVVKIKLSGSIMMGTTAKIMCEWILPWNHITYAGTEILSIEEIEE